MNWIFPMGWMILSSEVNAKCFILCWSGLRLVWRQTKFHPLFPILLITYNTYVILAHYAALCKIKLANFFANPRLWEKKTYHTGKYIYLLANASTLKSNFLKCRTILQNCCCNSQNYLTIIATRVTR